MQENVKIIGQDHKGRGISKDSERIVFVEKALPGEVCDIEFIKDSKKYREAKVINIKKESSERVEVTCPYYDTCGGCDILHQKYEEQLKFKEKKLKDILKKFASVNIPLNKIVYDKNFYYRNKITLHNLGLYQKKTNQVVKVENCLLVHPKINELIKRVQEYSSSSNNVIDEVMIRVSNTEEVLMSATGKIQKTKWKESFKDVDVLVVNHHVLTEKDTIMDKIHDTYFSISSESFYQVNRFVTEKLYEEVLKNYRGKKNNLVLDLYCGTGTISLLVAPFASQVIGIEVVKEAIENANQNKEFNNIENVQFINGKVEDYIGDFQGASSIIVDPPRAGLDSKTIESILKINPDTITYVSCDPVTLARDLNILKEEYDVTSITPVDMFPNTYHVESVTVLHRKTLEK